MYGDYEHPEDDFDFRSIIYNFPYYMMIIKC